ncbi:MAG: Txe/YoeB family addiction module toxin [Bacteroidaceae bacterium]|nr:Txe/YoeB family addiction module toxin [Bacteroidaceae bacterium]
MQYSLRYTPEANVGLAQLRKSEPKAFKKAVRLLAELQSSPRTGTGHPEPLKGSPEGRWSRRITKKHRLVYQILDTEVVVLVLSAYGHYEDR